jgi:acetolactate synthase-1/3 small subunit
MPLPAARTFVVTVEDRPGVLNRVVSLIRRRNFNIESLAVGSTERAGVSRMTLVVRADDRIAARVKASLEKLYDVIEVEDVTSAPALVHELAFIKVRAPVEQRTEVLRLCEVFRGRVVDLSPATVVVEMTGSQERVDGLVEVLRPFGIAEMVRTGAVAMLRGGVAEHGRRDESAEAAA